MSEKEVIASEEAKIFKLASIFDDQDNQNIQADNQNLDIQAECVNENKNKAESFLASDEQPNCSNVSCGDETQHSLLPAFSKVSAEDLIKITNFLEFIKSTNLPASSVKESKTVDLQKSTSSITNNTMELVDGSNIIVNKWKIQQLLSLYRKKPRELVRQLMKLILGEEVLKRSSPTGKNGWTPIPDNVRDGVERFVNENAGKKKYQVKHQEYRQILTSLCATLRNPKKSKMASEKRKGENSKGKKQNDERGEEQEQNDESGEEQEQNDEEETKEQDKKQEKVEKKEKKEERNDQGKLKKLEKRKADRAEEAKEKVEKEEEKGEKNNQEKLKKYKNRKLEKI